MDSGIVLYEIGLHGCLTGVYTNEISGEVFNEIAKLDTPIQGAGIDDIIGLYHCTYFEKGGIRKDAELTIDLVKSRSNVYTFHWRKNGKVVFEGKGYRMNERQLAIHYWDVA